MDVFLIKLQHTDVCALCIEVMIIVHCLCMRVMVKAARASQDAA